MPTSVFYPAQPRSLKRPLSQSQSGNPPKRPRVVTPESSFSLVTDPTPPTSSPAPFSPPSSPISHPSDDLDIPIRDLIDVVAAHIEMMCLTPSPAPPPNSKYYKFYSQFQQPFSLQFYISRLVEYANCSHSAFVVMLIYLDRIQQYCPELGLSNINCHRLITTALLLAIKYLDDQVFSNVYYARVGGVGGGELNELETCLLDVLKWNVCVGVEQFDEYCTTLREALAYSRDSSQYLES